MKENVSGCFFSEHSVDIAHVEKFGMWGPIPLGRGVVWTISIHGSSCQLRCSTFNGFFAAYKLSSFMFLSDEYSLHNALPCELQVRFEKNYGLDR